MAGKSTVTWQARFWRFVDKRGKDECWPWTGGNNGKYGVMSVGGKYGRTHYAHRLSWTIANCEIPNGMHVCHRCDNPPCVNPAHLFIGTVRDNALDKSAKGRHWMQKNGDKSSGANNPNALLEWDQVRNMRSMYADGISQMELSRRFNVGRTTVGHIIHRRTWIE